jgi:hypothetical protein
MSEFNERANSRRDEVERLAAVLRQPCVADKGGYGSFDLGDGGREDGDLLHVDSRGLVYSSHGFEGLRVSVLEKGFGVELSALLARGRWRGIGKRRFPGEIL